MNWLPFSVIIQNKVINDSQQYVKQVVKQHVSPNILVDASVPSLIKGRVNLFKEKKYL